MLHGLATVDWGQVGASLGILATAIGLTWAGVRKGVKVIKGEATTTDAPTRITGGIIMGSTEVVMLSERLREASEELREVITEIRASRHQAELRDARRGRD